MNKKTYIHPTVRVQALVGESLLFEASKQNAQGAALGKEAPEADWDEE